MNDKLSTSNRTQVESLPDVQQMQHYVAIWRQRIAAQQAEATRVAAQARLDAEQIAILLHERFSATRVLLFGSLVKGGFAPGSDIDLAVTGIPKAEFFAAVAAANTLAHTWVDLKPLEDLHPHFRQRVLETGVDLL
ncbi:MAG: nucleotidyltransferase domain-containing protein [Caldilineaceae bacterium]